MWWQFSYHRSVTTDSSNKMVIHKWLNQRQLGKTSHLLCGRFSWCWTAESHQEEVVASANSQSFAARLWHLSPCGLTPNNTLTPGSIDSPEGCVCQQLSCKLPRTAPVKAKKPFRWKVKHLQRQKKMIVLGIKCWWWFLSFFLFAKYNSISI